jgi:hypothetical protein
MKPINIFCGQNAVLLITKAGGTYGLKGKDVAMVYFPSEIWT